MAAIVKVLPEPVCPNMNSVTTPPSAAFRTSGAAVLA
jgi:hypothetical protein